MTDYRLAALGQETRATLFLSCSVLVNFSTTVPLCGFLAGGGGNGFLLRRCAEVRAKHPGVLRPTLWPLQVGSLTRRTGTRHDRITRPQ